MLEAVAKQRCIFNLLTELLKVDKRNKSDTWRAFRKKLYRLIRDAIKLGAIAVLTLNPETGELHADEVGERNTKKGALWGTAIGVGVGILTAGIGLIPGLLIGAGGGAAIGAMDHKGVGMTDQDRERMAENLRRGGAALAVMCDDFEVEATKEELACTL